VGTRRLRLDPLGALLCLAAGAALLWLPLLVFKPNRILPGEPRALLELLPSWAALGFAAVLVAAALAALGARNAQLRLWTALGALTALVLVTGTAAEALTPAGNRVVRVAPGGAFWVLAIALGLLATDALTALRPRPGMRVLCLVVFLAACAALLGSGALDALSVMREYAVNAPRFAHELRRHLLLALGSLALGLLVALPLGIACHRRPRWRAAVLAVLNGVQTIPSIALLGILIAPLAALAAALPVLAQWGVGGIGVAPALIALVLYALLPITGNTVAGLARVSGAAVDAARGMGMTAAQVLREVELPLALPTILAGIRIVLVQNIGLATVAALIGSGGLGAFVFQGIGQAAIDLVLLGAIPTVALAFAAAVVLDALVDLGASETFAGRRETGDLRAKRGAPRENEGVW
jgi:osmoprotectant transport system permease protein